MRRGVWREALRTAAAAAGVVGALATSAAEARTPVTARDLALGGTGAASAVGVEALWVNPANLAAPGRPGMSLMILSVAGGVSNNSWTLDQYNRFTRPGTELSFSDKEEILGSIPEGELRLHAEAAANALAMTLGPFGIAVTPRGSGSVTLAKDYFDLLLEGNELDRTYSFDGTSGESIALLETAISYGRSIPGLWMWNGRWGVSAKMLSAGAGFEVVDARGRLVTTPTKAFGEADVRVRYSGETVETGADGGEEYRRSPGRGYAWDVALAADLSSRWRTAFVLRDLGARITWERGTERTYSYAVDSLTVENAADDDLVVEEETERPLDSFTLSLPATMHVELTRQTHRSLLSVGWDQALHESAGESTSPRVTAGTELRVLSWLPLRTHVAVGGGRDACLGGGFGLGLGGWRIDVGGVTRSLTPGQTKGGLLAVTTYVRF